MTNKQEWIKEFDEKFSTLDEDIFFYHPRNGKIFVKYAFKSFISDLLKEERKRIDLDLRAYAAMTKHPLVKSPSYTISQEEWVEILNDTRTEYGDQSGVNYPK